MSALDWRRARTFKSAEDKNEPPVYRDRMDRSARYVETHWLDGLPAADAALLSGRPIAEIKAMRAIRRKRRKPAQ